MARIVVSGMIAGSPGHGGASWAILQYVLGLGRLGHDVVLVEPVSFLSAERAAYFEAITAEFDLRDRAALLDTATGVTVGLSSSRLSALTRGADMLLNASGLMTLDEHVEAIPVRAYLDLDPAFNQLWDSACGIDRGFAGHTHFVTVGLGLGRAGCDVPTCGREWIATLPPVVLEHWPCGDRVAYDAFTTVGQWRGYGSIEHRGVHYGQRAHAFRPYAELPARSGERLAPALAIHADERSDLAALRDGGWELLDPGVVAATPGGYRAFVAGSRAELAMAKSGYVTSRCGWFSDRSACYLASGRPVLLQDTGFSAHLPTGEGLLAFDGMEGALAGLSEIRAHWPRHSRAARSLAEGLFDSDVVLAALLEALA
jgi:hypothetical protein